MIKSELVERVMQTYPGLYQRDAETAVDAIFDAMIEALAEGSRVEIRGFGAFSAKQRRSRMGRNPRTGQRVAVDAKRVPMFKASKEIREALNPEAAKPRRAKKAAPARPAEAEERRPIGD